MRGLKPARKLWACRERKVASFTDAWIETARWSKKKALPSVASFTDAWIETKEDLGIY